MSKILKVKNCRKYTFRKGGRVLIDDGIPFLGLGVEKTKKGDVVYLVRKKDLIKDEK